VPTRDATGDPVARAAPRLAERLELSAEGLTAVRAGGVGAPVRPHRAEEGQAADEWGGREAIARPAPRQRLLP
jgi:hypothetical protein